MLLDFLAEQPIACKIIQNTIMKKSISHAYLIETNNYYRGLDFAIAFAKAILCPNNQLKLENCGKCTQCSRIDSKAFSELEIIEPDGNWIKKEQLDKLQKSFSTKSLESNKKVYIINHADRLNQASANSILKFLEEPEENIVAILLTDNSYSLLDTIVSRCQILKLSNSRNLYNDKVTIQKVANYLFNSVEGINLFINSNGNDVINGVLDFIRKVEEAKTEMILVETKLCAPFLKDKTTFKMFLDVSILFYKDCLDNKISNKVSFFSDYNDRLLYVVNRNTSDELIKKIEVLTKMQERLKYNCNLNLILDKLIILLGGV